MATTHEAFFYGTLMAPEVLSRVIFGTTNHKSAARLTVHPAVLTNYRRQRVLGCDYPAITAYSGSTVRGSYVSGLTNADLMRLDIFEGDQYSRDKVTVEVFMDGDGADVVNGEVGSGSTSVEKEAETYIWKTGAGDLEDKEWDFEHFRREKMKRWMGENGQPDDAVDEGFAEVDAVARDDMAGPDPTGGRGLNGHITQQLEHHNSNHHLRMG